MQLKRKSEYHFRQSFTHYVIVQEKRYMISVHTKFLYNFPVIKIFAMHDLNICDFGMLLVDDDAAPQCWPKC